MSKPIAEMSDAELAAASGELQHKKRIDEKRPTAKIQCFDEIDVEAVDWVWPGRIAVGKLTLFAGDPGLGKSQATLDVAGRLSTGIPFPDGAKCEQGDSLILTAEDDPGDTIRPRLDALEANLSKVHFLHCKVSPSGAQDIPSLLDGDIFKDAIDQIRGKGGNPRLLVIDPLEGFLDGADAHKNAEVRSALMPIVRLARKEGFAVLGVQHLNKGGGSPSYRVGGSIAFTALARAAWIFGKDQEDPDRRLFLCLKNNLGKDNSGLEYRVVEAANGAPRISWGGPADDDIRTVLSQERTSREDRVAPFQDEILEILKARYPRAVRVKELVELLDKSQSQVSTALAKLLDRGLAKRSIGVRGYWEAVIITSSPVQNSDDNDDSDDEEPISLPLLRVSPSFRAEEGCDSCPPATPATLEQPSDEEVVLAAAVKLGFRTKESAAEFGKISTFAIDYAAQFIPTTVDGESPIDLEEAHLESDKILAKAGHKPVQEIPDELW